MRENLLKNGEHSSLGCFIYDLASLCYCRGPVPSHCGLLIRLPPHLKVQHVDPCLCLPARLPSLLGGSLVAGSAHIAGQQRDVHRQHHRHRCRHPQPVPHLPTASSIWLIARTLLLALPSTCLWLLVRLCACCLAEPGCFCLRLSNRHPLIGIVQCTPAVAFQPGRQREVLCCCCCCRHCSQSPCPPLGPALRPTPPSPIKTGLLGRRDLPCGRGRRVQHPRERPARVDNDEQHHPQKHVQDAVVDKGNREDRRRRLRGKLRNNIAHKHGTEPPVVGVAAPGPPAIAALPREQHLL